MDEQLRKLLSVLIVTSLFQGLVADVNVIKAATLRFGEALEHCREESGLTVQMMEEFYHFWSDNFKFEKRELGCALQCMSRYYNLLTDASRMHHENTEDFLKSIPNGEILAQKTVSMIHECEKQFNHEEDHCWRILHIAECFKDTCKREGLVPSMEVMIAEFIMDAEQ